jgi:hypothetical protein
MIWYGNIVINNNNNSNNNNSNNNNNKGNNNNNKGNKGNNSNTNNINNMLMPVKLNSFTHLRALLVLYDRAFWPTELASLFLQLKPLRYWYYGSGTMTLGLDIPLSGCKHMMPTPCYFLS